MYMLSICMRIILCIYQQSIIPTTLGKLHDHPNLFFFFWLFVEVWDPEVKSLNGGETTLNVEAPTRLETSPLHDTIQLLGVTKHQNSSFLSIHYLTPSVIIIHYPVGKKTIQWQSMASFQEEPLHISISSKICLCIYVLVYTYTHVTHTDTTTHMSI